MMTEDERKIAIARFEANNIPSAIGNELMTRFAVQNAFQGALTGSLHDIAAYILAADKHDDAMVSLDGAMRAGASLCKTS